MPTMPTPMADPKPAKPTWKLPVNSANIGVTIILPLLFAFAFLLFSGSRD
jgi:hypothetical protein